MSGATVKNALAVAAISEAATAAAGGGWEEIRTAASPSDTELLALAARLCET
jgi:uroporphyrinogen-III synthase